MASIPCDRALDSTLVLLAEGCRLNLYGTDHDARAWEEPDTFRRERFCNRDRSAYNLIPQGGGDHYDNHRCAGEWITIELLKRAVRILAKGMRWDVPGQDLSVDLSRMPAVPRSGFAITNVRPAR